MKMKKEIDQREIGRIRLSDKEDLVSSLVDNEKLDLRIWVKTNNYTGPTKRGLRIYVFDGNWEGFKKLIEQVDKVYQGLA